MQNIMGLTLHSDCNDLPTRHPMVDFYKKQAKQNQLIKYSSQVLKCWAHCKDVSKLLLSLIGSHIVNILLLENFQ